MNECVRLGGQVPAATRRPLDFRVGRAAPCFGLNGTQYRVARGAASIFVCATNSRQVAIIRHMRPFPVQLRASREQAVGLGRVRRDSGTLQSSTPCSSDALSLRRSFPVAAANTAAAGRPRSAVAIGPGVEPTIRIARPICHIEQLRQQDATLAFPHQARIPYLALIRSASYGERCICCRAAIRLGCYLSRRRLTEVASCRPPRPNGPIPDQKLALTGD
jgi:hypothetical protein